MFSTPTLYSPPQFCRDFVQPPIAGNDPMLTFWVHDLPLDLQEPQLYSFFSSFGQILHCGILRDASGQSIGEGWLLYNCPKENMDALLKNLNQKFWIQDNCLSLRPVLFGTFTPFVAYQSPVTPQFPEFPILETPTKASSADELPSLVEASPTSTQATIEYYEDQKKEQEMPELLKSSIEYLQVVLRNGTYHAHVKLAMDKHACLLDYLQSMDPFIKYEKEQQELKISSRDLEVMRQIYNCMHQQQDVKRKKEKTLMPDFEIQQKMYKTRLCIQWLRYERSHSSFPFQCPRGDSCLFAHGREELRKNPCFKTRLCEQYVMTGSCRFVNEENGCQFAHELTELMDEQDDE